MIVVHGWTPGRDVWRAPVRRDGTPTPTSASRRSGDGVQVMMSCGPSLRDSLIHFIRRRILIMASLS